MKYRPDGTLVALGYNGDIWHLKDTDGDGVEDKAELFFESKGKLRGPIGMDLTPPDYKHGDGRVRRERRGRCRSIVDTDNDGKADKEIIVADGWKEITQSVDAIGVAHRPEGRQHLLRPRHRELRQRLPHRQGRQGRTTT